MPLSMCGNGSVCIVKKVGGNSAVRQHLNNLGFNVGTPVTVVSTLGGGLIVRVKDARVAIDRGMANRILV